MSESKTRLTSAVDRRHTAVLVVDVQPFFTQQDLVPPVDEVLPAIGRGPQFILVGEERPSGESGKRGMTSILEAAVKAGIPRRALTHGRADEAMNP